MFSMRGTIETAESTILTSYLLLLTSYFLPLTFHLCTYPSYVSSTSCT